MAGKTAVLRRANELLTEVEPDSRVRSAHFDAIFRAIYEVVRDEGRVSVQHFGTFVRTNRAPRRGWDARENKPRFIPASCRLMFKSKVQYAMEDQTCSS